MPTWTKKDYEMVAQVLRDSPLDDRFDTKDGDRDILVQAFAQRFRVDNPLFDSTRFDAAVFHGELTGRGGVAQFRGSTQDYRMVADVLRNSIASDAAKVVTTLMFADRFAQTNSRFKRALFYKAALGPDYDTKIFHWGEPGEPPSMRSITPPRRHPGDIPVVSHLRRRPRKSIVDFAGHRIRVKEWPSSAGMATLRRHMKRQHPIRWRLSIRKGVATRRRRREEAS